MPNLVRKYPPYKVFFSWEITYECNYRCSYCHAPKPYDVNTKKTVYLKPDEWLNIWSEIYDNYGECEMVISGGEPFVYPEFVEIIKNISRLHIVELCTNLSSDIEPIMNINPKRLRVGTSFHPEFAELKLFINKIKRLQDNGFEVWVNFVPWPPLFKEIKKIKGAFESEGIKVILQPFIGQYEGRQYPRGYTEEEKKYLGIFDDETNTKTLEFKTTSQSNKKGKLCRMGQNYGFIHPDGSVDRCCRDKSIQLGNIISKTFKLLEEPIPCQIDECNCSRAMLVETEPEWVKFWGRNG